MNSSKKKWMTLLALFSTGVVFQYLGGGCTQFITATALDALDFCTILNCDQGSFFNLCDPVILLVDCL